MARNIVKTEDFSFKGLKREGMDYRLKAVIVFAVCAVISMQVTVQYIAHKFGYDQSLGFCVPVAGYPVYPFYNAVYWLYVLLSSYDEALSSVASTSGFMAGGGLILSVFMSRKLYLKGKSASLASLHGSAHWATMKEIKAAGLLDSDGEPFKEGVVVGGVKVGDEIKMMRHHGREHVLCYAPTRSGKGISLVLPTLLDGWNESVFVLDIKQENYVRS